MRAYIIEHRQFLSGYGAIPNSRISQEGYTTLEAAQAFIERKPGAPEAISPMFYETEDGSEQYLIHDVMIVERLADVRPPHPRPYERARDAVHATGNKWAIENFHATHD